MTWYYAEAGKQVGPITEEELLRLAETGKIASDTLVWHEGLPNWQVYGYAKPTPVGAMPPPPVPPPTPSIPLGVNETVCVECGKVVPVDEAISYGGASVCANCKPIYFQKIKEGANLPFLPTNMPYAGFWIRFGAKIVDGLIVGIVVGIPMMILLFSSVYQARN